MPSRTMRLQAGDTGRTLAGGVLLSNQSPDRHRVGSMNCCSGHASRCRVQGDSLSVNKENAEP